MREMTAKEQAERATRDAPKQRKLKSKPKDYVKNIGSLEDGDKIISTLRSRAQEAADFRYPFEREWCDAYLAWHQVMQEKDKGGKWRSNRFIPLIFQHIEASHPALMSAVFGQPNLWQFIAETPRQIDAADIMRKLLDWSREGPSRMRTAYEKALWWSLVIGTGYLDHKWMYEVEEKRVMVAEYDTDDEGYYIDKKGRRIDPGSPEHEDIEGNARKVKFAKKQVMETLDQAMIESINPFYVWAKPNSERGDDGGWYFLRNETSMDTIIEASNLDNSHLDAKAVAEYLDKYQEQDPRWYREFEGAENLNFNIYEDLMEEVGYRGRDYESEEHDYAAGEKPVNLLVYRSKEETVTIAPGWKILGYSENPYVHGRTGIVVHQHYPIDGCPYGRGLGTVLLPHQDLANENINRAMDVSEITAMAPIGVDRSRVSILDDNFRWKPNKLIRTRGNPKDAVTRLDMPDETNLAMQWDAHIKRDADDTTGVAEQARGIAPSGVNTATEFSGIQSNIKIRTFMHVERLKETVALSGMLLCRLHQQFMTQEQVIQVTGEDGLYYEKIDPIEILGDMQCRVTISPTALAPAMRVQQLISMTQVIVPLMQQGMTNPFFMQWIRLLLEEIDVPNIERFIPKNMNTVRDPLMENEALRRGVKVPVSMYDPHSQHIQHHAELVQEIQQQISAGAATDDDLAAAMEHIEEHFQKAQQGQGGPSGGQGGTTQNGQPGAAPGGSPERQQAQQEGAAQGSNGVPGASSPGPGAPAGRPIG